jgi:hypothetical protein
MTVSADLPIASAGDSILPVADAVVWYHRALCRIALPVGVPGKGVWQREAAGVVLTMEAGEGAALPTGKFARLLAMHLFDIAVRTGSALIEIGDDPVVFAERIGADTGAVQLRELQDQMIRLLAAHIAVGWDGGPVLSVFDGRGRPRVTAPAWRSSIRLSARFMAGLVENAVPLDRGILRVLADSALALDLYAWLASASPDAVVGWEDLRSRFGDTEQTPAGFRAGFEQALMQVQQTWPHFISVMRDDAVEFRPVAAPAPVAEAPVPAEPEPQDEAEDEDASSLLAELESELVYQAEPAPEPMPEPVPVTAPEPAPAPVERPRQAMRQTISLKSHLTGLPQVVWLQRANGRDNVVIEVTPGGRYDPENSTVIVLEPVALQVAGGLYARDFERVAAWAAANRDLIDDWWDSQLDDFEEVAGRVKKVPAPAWR